MYTYKNPAHYDGDLVGCKLGISLGISDGNSVGYKLGISLGTSDGT